MEFNEFLEATLQTLQMTIISTLFAYILGIPLGIILHTTRKGGILQNQVVNQILGFIINVIRSVPFLILLVFIMPFTKLIIGTTIGTTATIVPLVVAAAPFVARMVESSLKEVDEGVVEAAQAMGSSNFKIILKVLIPEAKSSLVIGAAISITTILGYSTLAGFVGGGGLGAVALNYGYTRNMMDVMLVTVVLLVIIVQLFQMFGTVVASKIDKKIKK